jgi:oligopeptide/dipeptide ABC transporter ATP-binding protein
VIRGADPVPNEPVRSDPVRGNAMPRSPLLEVRDLTVTFPTRQGVVRAVNGTSFTIDRGETLALVGESGSGKSVTSLAISGLLPRGARVDGSIRFAGAELASATERERERLRGRHVAMVFQDPQSSLNPVLRIEEQVAETIRAHEPVTREVARRRVRDLLGQVGMPRPEDVARSFPHQLSGGMRQRVMIAIAMALNPELLVADEPTTALDATIQAQILELLLALTADHGTATLLITHDMGVVARMSQRVAVMYAGYVVESAPTRQLFAGARHPYTLGLLRSTPRIDRPIEELRPIPGAPPDPARELGGCPFAPRCARRLPVCDTVMPPLAPIGVSGAADPAHLVACHNPVPVEQASAA